MHALSETGMIEIWNRIYNLSVNMLHNPADAEDAVQQIFEKVFAKLQSFEGRSKMETWIYAVARNHLIDQKRLRFRDEISFELFEQDITGFKPYENEFGLNREEEVIFAEQVKTGCTLAMLQCLDPLNRFVFIIGNIFNASGSDGAEICGLGEAAYRKQLSRAREKVSRFMHKNCGLINPEAECRCRKRLLIASQRGRIDPEKMLYQEPHPAIAAYIGEVNQLDKVASAFRSNPFYDKSALFYHKMKKRFSILRDIRPDLFNEDS